MLSERGDQFAEKGDAPIDVAERIRHIRPSSARKSTNGMRFSALRPFEGAIMRLLQQNSVLGPRMFDRHADALLRQFVDAFGRSPRRRPCRGASPRRDRSSHAHISILCFNMLAAFFSSSREASRVQSPLKRETHGVACALAATLGALGASLAMRSRGLGRGGSPPDDRPRWLAAPS